MTLIVLILVNNLTKLILNAMQASAFSVFLSLCMKNHCFKLVVKYFSCHSFLTEIIILTDWFSHYKKGSNLVCSSEIILWNHMKLENMSCQLYQLFKSLQIVSSY